MPHVPSWILADVPMLTGFRCVLKGINVRPTGSRKLVKKACEPSCNTELPPSDVDDLPSRGQLVYQAAEHEFGVKGRTRERKETHTEKDA